MAAIRISAMRTALRPLGAQAANVRLQQFPATQIRHNSGYKTEGQGEPTTTSPTDPTKQPEGVGEKGTAKVYNRDGTNPNKNVVYAGLAAVTLGAILYVSMSSPKKRDLDKSSASAAR